MYKKELDCRRVCTYNVRVCRPDEDELAKITRHEAHLERMLSKAMHELQRRQTKRPGGPAPLPLVVAVTGRGPFLDA